MKRTIVAIAIALAVVFQLRCSSGTDSNAQQTTIAPPVAEEESAVQIYHDVPAEVLLEEYPYIAEFVMEIPSGGTGDIAYYVVQYEDELENKYLPEGITYKEVLVPLDLEGGSAIVLVVASNSSGYMTRVQVKTFLNTDCPYCDLSWDGPANSAKYQGIDFCGADLTGVKMRNLSLLSTSFCGAILIGADFGSDLPESWTVLYETTFEGADLRDASFTNTTLNNLDFTNANLTGADLRSSEILNCTWSNTICPDGTNSDNNGGSCDKAL